MAGTNAWTKGDLTAMSLLFWLTHAPPVPMQTHVDAMQLGGAPARRSGAFSLVILGASAGTVVRSGPTCTRPMPSGWNRPSSRGAALWAFGRAPWQRWETWVLTGADRGHLQAYLFGAGFTLFLSALRARFVWWPFHPAGYLVQAASACSACGSRSSWWLVKALLLRGGLGRTDAPCFYGLVLGEFSAGFLRSLLDLGFGLNLPAGSGIGGL